DECWSGSFANLAGSLKVFDQDSDESRTAPSFCSGFRQKGGREMVRQRFLTHFKPWLYAVIKVAGLIVGYQLLDQTRAYFHYAPFNIADVMTAAIVALSVLALLC